MPHPILDEQLYLGDTQNTLLFHIRNALNEQNALLKEQNELLKLLKGEDKQVEPKRKAASDKEAK